jgi:glutathione S-transferase
MVPRQPPESPEDDEQSELLQAVHAALNEIEPVNGPADHQPVIKPAQETPHLTKQDEVDVEIDRIEAYLRGPTAFTA